MNILRKVIFFTTLFGICVFPSTTEAKADRPVIMEFSDYVTKYHKSYTPVDYDLRYEIFKHNLALIEKHNSENLGWKLSPNEWTDLTWEEFKRDRIGFRTDNSNKISIITEERYNGEIPSSVDWRTKHVVNPVKNQEQCGSCWAFSAISSIESAVAIKTGKLYSLSEQQLVDCSGAYGNMGCNGGLMDDAFQYAETNKLCLENDYPYTAQDGTCSTCSGVVSLKGYVDVASNNETALQLAVLKQPVSVAVEADQLGFQFYNSGVFDGDCGTNLDHGVVAVGYGTENGKDFWLVRNSWGSSWGDGGYIKLARGKNQCGIALQPSYPVV
jgi:C1A family cysteine protease